MDVSIIILSYNTITLLDRCLASVYRSLKNSSLKFEILVIDNNSTDGSKEMVKKKYPKTQVYANDKNVGYGKANNDGLRKAKGEYVLLLNSDCEVIDNAIEELFKKIKAKTRVFIGGKLLNEDYSEQQSCGPFYSLPVVFMMLFLKGDQLHVTRYSPRHDRQVDWVSGACIMGRKDDFLMIGGFDEEIFMYMEEIDLLYRAKQQGYSVWFTPDATFIHTGAASSKHKKAPVINIYRGLYYFYRKHYPFENQVLLKLMLIVKAWIVRGICGIMNNQELSSLYAKATAVLK